MPLRYSAHTLDSTASPKYLPSEPPEAPTCGCAGGVQCSGPLGVLELCAVVHAVSLALPLGAPGSVVGLAVYDSPGWAHRAAVCEYVTAYTFLCAPCLRCYRLSLDSFFARVAMARSCARAGQPAALGPQVSIRAGRAAGSAPRQSCLLVSPAPRPSLRPADATTPPCRVEARRGARAAHKAKPRRHYADYQLSTALTVTRLVARSPPPKATQYKRDQSRTGHRTTAHSRSHSGPYGP